MFAQQCICGNLPQNKCVITMQVVVIPSAFFQIPVRGSRMNAVFSSLRSKLCLLLLIVLVMRVGVVLAQTPPSQVPLSQADIARDLETIHIGEQQHISTTQQAVMWRQLAIEYQLRTEFPKAEDAYFRALRLLKTAPSAGAEYAFTLDNLSSLYTVYGRLDDAESARKQSIKIRRKLGRAAENGESEVHLADIALLRRQYKKAEQLAQQGLQMMGSSSNSSRSGMLSGFITLTYARCSQGHCGQGLMNARQAVVFANEHFESESVAEGFAKEALGFAEWKSGAAQDAEKSMLQALQILRTKLSPTDPRLAGAMSQYQSYLTEAHRPAEAQEIHEQITNITRQTGIYCQGCTVSVNSLSNTLR
jgi:tetratricopeptide (TPR) repeat protein